MATVLVERTGGFVLVVGPSGSGKDSVLRRAKQRFADNQRLVWPRRVITRPASVDEDNVSMTEGDFAFNEARGAFCLAWRAHGLCYGIPAEAEATAASGALVVCNVSRAVVAEARRRLLHVSVVLVTAPPEVLVSRLVSRGREQGDSLSSRLGRTVDLGDDEVDLMIANTTSLDAGVARFSAHLMTRLAPRL